MKYLFFFIIGFVLFSCSNNNEVYWCGDHACINKKEKEFYFKEKMVVEKRLVKKSDKLNKVEKDEILKKIRVKEKSRSIAKKKQKEEAHISKKSADKIIKQESSDNQTYLSKKECLNWDIKKRSLKECFKFKSSNQKIASKENIEQSSDFNELVEKIIKKNMSRPYPDINNIQN